MKENIGKLFVWYLNHQDELVKDFDGKYLVITRDGVRGAFDAEDEGYYHGVNTFGAGGFLLQRCSRGTRDYADCGE